MRSGVAVRGAQGIAGLGRWRGSWSSSATPPDGLGVYITNDLAVYQGTTYRANSTATVGVAPTNDTHWDIVAQAGTNGSNGTSGVSFTYQGAWVSGTPYLIGQWVTYGGNLYYCNGAIGNVTSPPNVDAGWNLGMSGGAAAAPIGQVPVVASRATGYLLPFATAAGNVTSISVNYGVVAPLLVPRDTTMDRIGLYINVGAATSLWRIGIYADNGSQYPGALVYDGGTVDSAAAGYKEVTIGSPVALSTGLYWAAAKCEVAFSNARGNVGPIYGVIMGTASATGDLSAGYIANLGSGAFPSTWPTWGTAGTGNITNSARVGIRVTA